MRGYIKYGTEWLYVNMQTNNKINIIPTHYVYEY